MGLIWVGGEDVDFPEDLVYTLGDATAGYSRCGVENGRSIPFEGGGVTDCWLHFRAYDAGDVGCNVIGLCSFSTGAAKKGIWIRNIGGTSPYRAGIYKYDGSTYTHLVSEIGTSLLYNVWHQFDFHIQSYGASGTVSLYFNGGNTPIATYTGDIAVSGVTSLDCLALGSWSANRMALSEFIIHTDDTRTMRVVTHAPTAAGDANTWTGTYADVDETTIADGDFLYVNSDAQDCLLNLNDLPTGVFRHLGMKVVARASKSVDSAIANLKLGIKYDGAIDVDAGQALTTGWATYERIIEAPYGSSEFDISKINAIQSCLRSAT